MNNYEIFGRLTAIKEINIDKPGRWMLLQCECGEFLSRAIERINVNGNYEPSNCTWIENKRQARNTRKVLRVAVNGDHQLLVDLANSAGIPATTIKGRLRRGWSVNEALTIQPVKGRNQSWRGCL